MPPLGSNSGLFTVSGFIVSLVGILKKKKEERRDTKRKKGRRNKTRKNEREEEGVKRKKNYLKKSASCWLQTGQAIFADLLGYSRLRGDSFRSSPFPIGTQAASSPIPQQPLIPQVWAFTLPRASGLGSGPSTPPQGHLPAG